MQPHFDILSGLGNSIFLVVPFYLSFVFLLHLMFSHVYCMNFKKVLTNTPKQEGRLLPSSKVLNNKYLSVFINVIDI